MYRLLSNLFTTPSSIIFAFGLLLSIIGFGGLDDLNYATPFWAGASILTAGIFICYWQFRNWLKY